VVKKTF